MFKMLHGQADQIVLLTLFGPKEEGKMILRNFGTSSSVSNDVSEFLNLRHHICAHIQYHIHQYAALVFQVYLSWIKIIRGKTGLQSISKHVQ
jgi:hypothetical protein